MAVKQITFDGVSRSVDETRLAQIQRELSKVGDKFTTDSTDLLGFVVSQLAYTEAGIFERGHQPMQFKDFVPVSTAAGEWATTVRYEVFDYAGSGKRHSGRGGDIPKVDVSYGERDMKVYLGAVGYDYTIQELRESAYLNKPLNQSRANAAMQAFERHINTVALVGEEDLTGIFNNADVPATSATTGTWSTATADQILNDMNVAISTVYTQSSGVEIPDTILLPDTQFDIISSRARSANSDTTILEYFLANNTAKARGVTVSVKAAIDLNGAGTAGADRMMVYTKNENKLVMHLPMPVRFLAPQTSNFDVSIPGEYKYSGVEFRYPKSALYVDGI